MEGTIGEIRLFAANFSPKSWAYCAGQQMSIAQNSALFAILGVSFGGNASLGTFNLPDLRGRVALGNGQGPGLTERTLGESAGTPQVSLSVSQMPIHNHSLGNGGKATVSGSVNALIKVNNSSGSDTTPDGNYLGEETDGFGTYAPSPSGTDSLNPGAIPVSTTDLSANIPTLQLSISGSGMPYPIMQPYVGMNYIICLFGIFPSRN